MEDIHFDWIGRTLPTLSTLRRPQKRLKKFTVETIRAWTFVSFGIIYGLPWRFPRPRFFWKKSILNLIQRSKDYYVKSRYFSVDIRERFRKIHEDLLSYSRWKMKSWTFWFENRTSFWCFPRLDASMKESQVRVTLVEPLHPPSLVHNTMFTLQKQPKIRFFFKPKTSSLVRPSYSYLKSRVAIYVKPIDFLLQIPIHFSVPLLDFTLYHLSFFVMTYVIQPSKGKEHSSKNFPPPNIRPYLRANDYDY